MGDNRNYWQNAVYDLLFTITLHSAISYFIIFVKVEAAVQKEGKNGAKNWVKKDTGTQMVKINICFFFQILYSATKQDIDVKL